jgi:hypothetical protein
VGYNTKKGRMGGAMFYCSRCGTQNPDGNSYCGKCGTPLGGQTPQAGSVGTTQRTSEYAIAALVLGILGMTLLPLLGSILAIIFGSIGKKRIDQDPSLKGREMAIAGLVLGIIPLVIGLLIIAFSIFMSGLSACAMPYW